MNQPAPTSDQRAWQRHLGPSTAIDDLIRTLATGSLAGACHATATRVPDAPALRLPGAERWHSHGELDERSATLAGWLVGAGVAPGDRVLLCGSNSVELVLAYLAILRVGGVVVLANPAYTRSELAHLVTDSGAAIGFGTALAGLVEQVVDLAAPLPRADPIPPVEAAEDAPALLAYTSGTTGVPKGVPLSNANLLASIRAAMAAWRWQPDDVLVHALPLSHQHGLGGVHATLLAGSKAVIRPAFRALDLAETAREHRASVLFAVPAMYERLVGDSAAAQVLSGLSLRLAVSGSAPLDPELTERVAAVLGEIPLERYGSTEAGLDISNPIDGPRLPGTVGLPLPGIELRIADPAGAPVEEGEILVRGPQVFTGYWNRPDATAEAFHPGGWFRTGDLGRIEPESGFLRITGRLKELIISGGLNVYPAEVERVLRAHPSVAEAAVAGLASPRWGEQVTAWVELDAQAELDAEALIAHCRANLAAYKCPKQVFAVDALPRNGMGKLLRRELARADPPVDTTDLDRAVERLRRADLR